MLSRLQREAEAGMRSLRKGPRAGSRAAGALEPSMAAQRPSTQRQATAARSAPQQPRILAGQALPDSFLYTRADLSLQEGREELIEFANTIFIRSLCKCLKSSQERCPSMLKPSLQRHILIRREALIRTYMQVAVEAQVEGATPAACPNIAQWPP